MGNAVPQSAVPNDADETAHITVNVYNLGSSASVHALNSILRSLGSGLFHCGVEVYGQEWSYGACYWPPGASGVFCRKPKRCEGHVFSEAVSLGSTTASRLGVAALLEKLKKDWLGRDYDILEHNCVHFSEELCRCLGANNLPDWIKHLANAGAAVQGIAKVTCAQVNKLTSTCREDEELEPDCRPLHCLIARCPQQDGSSPQRPLWQKEEGRAARRRMDRYEIVETKTVFQSPFPGADVSEAKRAVLAQDSEAEMEVDEGEGVEREMATPPRARAATACGSNRASRRGCSPAARRPHSPAHAEPGGRNSEF